MYNKLLFSVFITISFLSNAQDIQCKAAKDSILARKNRGEIACYYPAKYMQNQYFYISFCNNKYTKKQLPVGSINNDFLICYNKQTQQNLDSVFKVDFFRKTDSILAAFDNSGRGYRNTDFPGGAFALQKYLSKNVNLSNNVKASNNEKSIKVYYSFLVNEEGNISDIKLVKSNCKTCEEEVLKAVQKLPNFIPATEAGKPKSVRYILPFTKK